MLAEACFRNFERTRDPSFLPPALPGMPKERIIPFLPKLLDPVSLFSVALARIFLPLPSGTWQTRLCRAATNDVKQALACLVA